MNYPENYTNQLKRVLQMVLDSHKGYSEAIEEAGSQEFKDLFSRIASERETIASQLIERIKRYGGDPADENKNELLGMMHRGWMGIKTSVAKKTDQTVLESCRNGDQAILDLYDDILQGDLLNDTDMKTFLMEQRYIINNAFMELDKKYFDLFKKDTSI